MLSRHLKIKDNKQLLFGDVSFFKATRLHTATRRVGKILVVVSGKTVSEILKIHTFLISIFNPLFDKITNNFKL